MYADDTNIMYYGKENRELVCMMEDLSMLDDWFQTNSLEINVDKTSFIILTKPSQFNSVYLNLDFKNLAVKRVSSAKYLGLLLDEHLTWSAHIKYVNSKIMPMVRVLYKMRTLLSEKNRKILYYSYVHSHLLFLCSVWRRTTAGNLYILEKSQRVCFLSVFSVKKIRHGYL